MSTHNLLSQFAIYLQLSGRKLQLSALPIFITHDTIVHYFLFCAY